MKVTLILIFIFLFISCEKKSNRFKVPIVKEDAIKIAEQFILDNGYTYLPPNKSKISYELFDGLYHNIDSILKNRYNILQRKAFYYSEHDDRWNIGFLYTSNTDNMNESLEDTLDLKGRAVIVMKSGKEVRLAHKIPIFSNFKKL
jgi:hypothetical protein